MNHDITLMHSTLHYTALHTEPLSARATERKPFKWPGAPETNKHLLRSLLSTAKALAMENRRTAASCPQTHDALLRNQNLKCPNGGVGMSATDLSWPSYRSRDSPYRINSFRAVPSTLWGSLAALALPERPRPAMHGNEPQKKIPTQGVAQIGEQAAVVATSFRLRECILGVGTLRLDSDQML